MVFCYQLNSDHLHKSLDIVVHQSLNKIVVHLRKKELKLDNMVSLDVYHILNFYMIKCVFFLIFFEVCIMKSNIYLLLYKHPAIKNTT